MNLGDLGGDDWKPPGELPDLHGPQTWDLETWDPNLKTLGPGWAYRDRKKYGHTAGFAVAADNLPEGLYIPIRHIDTGGNLPEDTVLRWAKHQLAKPVPKIFANASYDIGWLQTDGLDVDPTHVEDIQIQAPLLNEYETSYSLNALAFKHLNERKDEAILDRALIAHGHVTKGGKADKGGLAKMHPRFSAIYGGADARLTRGTWEIQRVQVERENLTRIYDLERQLVHVVVAMRKLGVRVDNDKLERLCHKWRAEASGCIETVLRHTNVNVTAWDSSALERALNHCGITVLPTAEGKPSITAEWLDQFKAASDTQTREVAGAIGRLRLLDKAVNTFLIGAWQRHQVDGRVHVQFNQLRSDDGGTVSGRFSSSDFNMQNQPARDEEIGPEVRSVAIPEEGKKWLAADYASQEPRLTVHWACKAGLISAFKARDRYINDPETDYHQMVADICGITRKQAKPINLGLAYGMGGPKLCRSLGLPTARKIIRDRRSERDIEIEVPGFEGQRILDAYDRGVPFVRKLFRLAEDRAKTKGYIVTLLGRKCRTHVNQWKNADTRKALNKLIQGSAADQTKETMRQLYYDHGITPMVTVHDELGFSVEDTAQAWQIVGLMEQAIELEVPTVVDCKLGDNWGYVEKLKRAA